MSQSLEFETPENVQLAISPAGLGTRFYAWVFDHLLMFLVFLLVVVLAVIAFAAMGPEVDDSIRRWFRSIGTDEATEGPEFLAFVFFGILVLLWGLSGFVYYGVCELLMRGQTPGKRSAKIRVVKADGFSLDATSILVRNLFRVVDHLPVLWIVPLLSAKSQRLGDMVAGTIVVQDDQTTLSPMRTTLAERASADSKFQFSIVKLHKLRPQDLSAIEQLLERWPRLTTQFREDLMGQVLPAIVKRLDVPAPDPADRLVFLSDLLAAEYRRQNRHLG